MGLYGLLGLSLMHLNLQLIARRIHIQAEGEAKLDQPNFIILPFRLPLPADLLSSALAKV